MAHDRRIAGLPNPVTILDDHNESVVTHDGVKIVDIVHWHVHERRMFHIEHGAASLANNGTIDFRILTGTLDVHTGILFSVGGQANIYLYEGITVTGNGNLVTALNMKRSAPNVSEARFYTSPTMTFPSGTQIISRTVPGGTSPTTRAGAEARAGVEWILKPQTNYGLRIQNTSGGAVPAWFIIEFYEESD